VPGSCEHVYKCFSSIKDVEFSDYFHISRRTLLCGGIYIVLKPWKDMKFHLTIFTM
jgi:hypothetical protein